MKQKLLLLIALIALSIPAWAEPVIILQEDFTGIAGNNTSTSGSSAGFNGTTNFPISNTAYQAGNAVKVGSGSKIGSITSRALDLSVNEGVFTVSFEVKGWTTVEGQIKVTTGCTPATITKAYTSVLANPFETITMEFTGGKINTTIKIESTAKRAFITNIKVFYEASAPTAPTINITPATLDPFSATIKESAFQTIKVGAINLTDFLNLEISGADAGLFTVTPELLMPEVDPLSPDFGKVADTDVAITYSPTVVGTHTATLTLKSLGATDVTFALSGTAVLPTLATPVATEATAITEKGFTTNWDAVPNTTEYELNILEFNPNIIRDGTKENPYIVANSRAGNLTNSGWLAGYIVGTATGNAAGKDTLDGYVTFGGNTGTVNTNIVLADSPAETDGSKLIVVEITGAIRTALNLADNKQNVGRSVLVKGNFTTYFGLNPGVKGTSDYVLDAVIPGDEVVAGSPFTITDATSFEVTGLKHNTDYKYSVVAKGVEHLNSEPSNVIAVKTNDIIPTEVVSIADITDPNVYYQVNKPLEGVYQVGNVAYVKNEIGGNPNKTTRPEHFHGDLDADFEQSSWMKITAPDAKNYAGSSIDAGIMGKLNAETGAFDVITMPVHAPKTDAYVPFYKNDKEKHNSFTLRNFFPQAPGYYYIAPQDNEVAYICQVRFKTENNKLYFTAGTDQIEVKQTVPVKTDIITKIENDPTTGYNAKVIFLKQPSVTSAGDVEWIIEHIDTDASVDGNVTTGVNDVNADGGSDVKVIGTNGAIEVFAADASAINVYNLSGSIVRSINNADNHTSISIPAGAYIVKVQNTVVKVIVK